MSLLSTDRVQRVLVRVLRHWPLWLVTAVGLFVIWPVPLGRMPLSADHTVHLGRTWLWLQSFSGGHVSGWSSAWFFGFPVGELYPILCDAAVIAVRWLSFGQLSWPTSYAFAFTLAYVGHGLVLLRVSHAAGLGPLPGVLAAWLTFLDPGALREGGFNYTVSYGVWLQPVAVALLWWAFAELARVVEAAEKLRSRRLLLPALLLSMALLCHSVAVPMVALLGVLFVLFLGLRRELAKTVLATLLVLALGVGLAAWWLFPLLAQRAWMSNYGTLYGDLATMMLRAAQGAWSQHMAAPVGYAIWVGIVVLLVRGTRFAKFMVVAALILWLMSTQDIFFTFRLDWLSESARYLQYQRFIICAKPGLYIAAGAGVVAVANFGLQRWRAGTRTREAKVRAALGVMLAAVACALLLGSAVSKASERKAFSVRVVRNNDARFHQAFNKFTVWSEKEWAERDGFYRFAYKAARHAHSFMDAPVFNGAPSYKLGFTPGDLFMHKPESAQPEVLDRLRVRYVVGTEGLTKEKPVKQFGALKVFERPLTEQVARLVGGGELSVLEDDPDGGRVVVRVSNAAPGARLEFNIAGYPRWKLERDGKPVEWYEVPVIGNAKPITQQERRSFARRSTGAGLSPPATDPMLLAADATNGTYVLRYRHWLSADVVGWSLTALALLFCGFLARSLTRSALLLGALQARLTTWVLAVAGALLIVLLALRWGSGFVREAGLASGWLRVGKSEDVVGMLNGPLKVERVIGSAVLASGRDAPATITFPQLAAVGESIEGWVAVADGKAVFGEGQARLTASGRANGGEWIKLSEQRVQQRPGRQPIVIPLTKLGGAGLIDLKVTVRRAKGDRSRLGFDLALD